MSRTTLPKRRRNGASFHASVPRRFRRISTPMRPSSLPVFLPRVSPSFLCPLDRPAQYRERDEETEKRKRETADLVSFIFHGARFVKRIRSSTGSFVFVSEARNSACPSQLCGRDTRFAAKAAFGIVGARGVIPQPLLPQSSYAIARTSEYTCVGFVAFMLFAFRNVAVRLEAHSGAFIRVFNASMCARVPRNRPTTDLCGRVNTCTCVRTIMHLYTREIEDGG